MLVILLKSKKLLKNKKFVVMLKNNKLVISITNKDKHILQYFELCSPLLCDCHISDPHLGAKKQTGRRLSIP